ncbi:C69 family dipeptidase [Phormidium sp. CCY1219]|uniref:C69 family dipeptidase n=1 Tax=Phormidium sp. CCY1219 TaxID=2886104 RepID=UPI002D1EA8F6|nr:C69 family dipeptidase [Phormidium sp. CCY1219]MEB3827126.1 C69 family dipeptidase [Phormidium sp. CCY1219]
MCDTFVALPDATVNGDVIFGKNSDRPAGEIQEVIVIPATTHSDPWVNCTYLKIPQVETTHAVILSQPRWMWGAEMGANECGVAIGNEAVWTVEPYENSGLLGMDLVRLGLERGETAFAALEVITDLLEKYGQGGNCAEDFAMNYHNSFLIADKDEAWVLETAGQYWVAQRVTEKTRSISNALSIRNAGDLRHPEVISHAIDSGWCRDRAEFDFAKLFSAGGVSDSLSPHSREGRVRLLCQRHQGQFTLETAQGILCDHEGNICMHGAFESAGSQVSSLNAQGGEHWFIEQPFPCQQTYRQKQFALVEA